MKPTRFASVAFTGSRRLSPAWAPQVKHVVEALSPASILVGDARGADRFVAAAAPADRLRVFRVGRSVRLGRGAFAARSVEMIRALASSPRPCALVAFVAGPCPAGIIPATSWRSGSIPSGSWASVALAAGLELPVFVFVCPPSGRSIVHPSLPAWAGSWSPIPSGALDGAWRWSPVAAQARLF